MKDILKFEYPIGIKEIHPAHPMVKSWVFSEDEEDEAILIHAIATVAEKNGIDVNHLSHLYPAILRMLKSNIKWSK